MQDTNDKGQYRLCFTVFFFLPDIFIQESVKYPFLFTVVYKLVQHDKFLLGSSHSSDCTDPQQGGGGKCFGNGSQDRAQLHNCTKEKGFFLFCFVFPSHILLPTEKKCCWKAGWKKTSASFIPVGA